MSDNGTLNALLKMAVLAGVETAVRLHIRRGDNLNARDAAGMTPLMLAASKNRAAVCSLLLGASVDPGLTDTSGRDALAIAKASRAEGVIAVLEAALALAPGPVQPKPEPSTEPGDEPEPNSTKLIRTDLRLVPDSGCESPSALPSAVQFDDEWDASDLSGWEPDDDGPPPEGDPTITKTAAAVQSAISAHDPVDDSAGWDDFEAFLPERAAPLPGMEGGEESAGLRRLLLRAIREGSVPDDDLVEACKDKYGSLNPAWESLLRLVLGELGAETDERVEYGDEPFMAEGREDEDVSVSEALAFIEDVASGRNDPGRFYSKEMRVGALLTADEEELLGREMEEGLADASGALASWPEGVASVLEAGERVRAGKYGLSSISLGSWDAQGEEAEVSPETDEVESDSSDADATLTDRVADFLETIDEIAARSRASAGNPVEREALAGAIARARLSPLFLGGLDVHEWSGAAADTFRSALTRYYKARETMVLRNLRLVISVVKRYQGLGLPFEDLVQEGNIGLLKAVEKYDYHKGFRLSTYASWWIRQQATRSIADMGRTIRIPVHVHEKMLWLRREMKEAERKHGQSPSDAWLAEKMGMAVGKLSAMRARIDEPTPLHELNGSGQQFAADTLAEDQSNGPEARVERASLIRTLWKMLAELDPRAAEVMVLRFGLDGTDSRTLEETGEHFGVTRERIRQIEAKALKKLAHPSRSSVLADFLCSHRSAAKRVSDPAPRLPLTPEEACVLAPEPDATDTTLVAFARSYGAAVEDLRAEGGGIELRLPHEKGEAMRLLAPILLAAGFSPCPGMTFRK
ncbi:sigma-70 family RNA polymerase sigma factor [Accumulibacter sp.]|uniref:sigma-70 family RNA polymerase sigma factor n=1 Tax=Accumulibacter sp. TaxID=2053492 RepID=UPI0028C3C5FF|nr:sigma-70 family RNA polymerase sigma factor [Accumulibacter sp.]